MLLLVLYYSKLLNEPGQYFMFRWGKFELERNLVSVSNEIKTKEDRFCVCKFSRSFLVAQNSLKQPIFETFLSFVVA